MILFRIALWPPSPVRWQHCPYGSTGLPAPLALWGGPAHASRCFGPTQRHLAGSSWSTETQEACPPFEETALPSGLWWGWQPWQSPNCLRHHSSLFFRNRACSQLNSSMVPSWRRQESNSLPSSCLPFSLVQTGSVFAGIVPSLFLASVTEMADSFRESHPWSLSQMVV